MEAVRSRSSPDQSISPHKQFRNSNRNSRPVVTISRRSENYAPFNCHGGVLHAPPPLLSFSYPPPVSFLNPQQQPPLLPLPITKPNSSPRIRGHSCSPINRKINNRMRTQSLTPRKSKPTITNPKRTDPKRNLKSVTTTASSSESPATSPMGPDPKDVSGVLSSSSTGNYNDLERFSSSVVFTISPPPSSLPFPTFSLRPRLSCNAEASGIDAGATDNLRRLLRLR
ncbi:hypothetical protein U1Q18_005995 [Sarracenia purpurea var. burkii]